MNRLLFVAGAIVILVAVAATARRPLLRWRRRREVAAAVAGFRVQREQLEARFFDLVRGRGVPKGLRWLECDWLDHIEYGRATDSGVLSVFASVNIRFEAIEGGDMEDVEAVGLIRDATAVFHYRSGQWDTDGRVLFNMDPAAALERLEGQYEEVELPDRSREQQG